MKEKDFFGFAVMAVGCLIMLLSGGCSIWYLIKGQGGLPVIVLVVGGIPFLLGMALFALGSISDGKSGPGRWNEDDPE
jgi:hypothetical protein